MRTLRFNFTPPFKGHAIIKMLDTVSALCKHFSLESKDSNLIEIPVDNLLNGKYAVTVDWASDERSFFYQQEFELKNSAISAS